jgi:hypothetical protein
VDIDDLSAFQIRFFHSHPSTFSYTIAYIIGDLADYTAWY